MANVSIGGIGFDLRAYGSKFSKDVQKAMGRVSKQMTALGGKMQNAGKGMTAGLTLPLLAFGASSVKVFAGFEQEMAKVKAVSGATGEEFAMLEGEAKRLGGSTRFAASEVAGLQLEYSKLGFKPEEIKKATAATLALAQASGSDLAESAAVAGGTLRGFQLDAAQMGRVTDVMAASFSSSALDLTKFKESMKFVAPVAQAAGVSLEESSALLSVLGDNMISGSQAGTGLRRIMSEMAKTGKPFSEALDEIAERGIGLTDAQDEVGRSAQTALLVLAKNREKVKELTKAYESSEGAAAKMAAIMDDTTAGAGKRLASAFESLQIAVGGILAKVITPFVEKLAVWIGKFSMLDEGTQKIIVGVGLLAAAIGPVLLALGAITAAIPAVLAGLGALGALISGPVILAVAAIAGVVAILITNKEKVVAVISDAVNTVKTWFSKWRTDNAETLAALGAAWQTLSAAASRLFTAIWTTVSEVTASIVAKLNEWLAPIGGLEGAWSIFATTVVTALTTAFTFVSETFNSIATILESNGSLWDKLKGLVGVALGAIGDLILGLGKTALVGFKAMGEAILSIDWKQIGIDIIRGIGNGISSMGGWLKDQAVGAASAAWKGTKDFLLMRSPSRLMKAVGQNFSLGMGVGITDKASDVAKRAVVMAGGAVSGVEGELGKLGSKTEETGKDLDSVFESLKSGMNDGKLNFKEWADVGSKAITGLAKAFGGSGAAGGGLLGAIGSVVGAFGGGSGSSGSLSGAVSSIAGLFGGGQSGGSTGTGGGGGTLSSLVGIASTLGGFFEQGGRPPAGRPSVVGEGGPELFVPDTAGTVIPNNQLNATGATGGGMNIQVTNHFSAGVTRAELASVIPTLQKNVMKGIVEGVQRGGSFRKAIQS